MSVITASALQRVYPSGHAAIRHADLEVADGELLVLVGPSGCGKSTLLRLIAGLDAPTSGRILIDGVDVTNVPPQARDLAMVFQSYALYPHMTVYDNLAYSLRVRRRAEGVSVDDGNTRNVTLTRKGERLVGTTDDTKLDLPGNLIPTTLWNSAVVEQSSVLETVKGRERTFSVAQKGVEKVKLPVGDVMARHFVFTGDFSREAWYDDSGVLVASQMEGRDGSIIRQELLRMP